MQAETVFFQLFDMNQFRIAFADVVDKPLRKIIIMKEQLNFFIKNEFVFDFLISLHFQIFSKNLN
jgi:hypothetical protein